MKEKFGCRWKGLLALILSLSILWGVSLPVMATTYYVQLGPDLLSVGQYVQADDIVCLGMTGGLIVYCEDGDGNLTALASSSGTLVGTGSQAYYHADGGLASTVPSPVSGATKWEVKTIELIAEGAAWKVILTPYPAVARSAKTPAYIAEEAYCNHNFVWTVIQEPTMSADGLEQEKCVHCGATRGVTKPISCSSAYVNSIGDSIKNAGENANVVMDTGRWHTINRKIAEALLSRPDISLTFNYTYENRKYTVTIPVGTDLTALLDENGYIGFRKLDEVYGGKEIQ